MPSAASGMPLPSAKDIELGLRLLTLVSSHNVRLGRDCLPRARAKCPARVLAFQLADLAIAQRVSDTALLKDLVDRLHDLKLHDFRAFVTVCMCC